MRKIILAIALLSVASVSAAADTINLSPEQVQYLLAQSGGVTTAPFPAAPAAPPAGAQIQPAPGPAVGVGAVGAPTYVLPEEKTEVIDIGQAFGQAAAPYINAIVQALIAGLISWVLLYIKKKTGIAIDAGHRDALITALQNQAGSLIADGLVKVEDGKVTVPDNAVTKAAADAIRSIPDAAKHLGLTPDYVAKRIVDMIPQTAAGAQMIAAAPPPPAPPAPPKLAA